jgi:hypothetical protein
MAFKTLSLIHCHRECNEAIQDYTLRILDRFATLAMTIEVVNDGDV